MYTLIPRRGCRLLTTTPRQPATSHLGIPQALKRYSKDLPPSIRGTPGRDLSQRYAQLERSLRCKAGLVKHRIENQERVVDDSANNRPANLHPPQPLSNRDSGPAPIKTFRGFVIPDKPVPPADDECCMSGCAICVYDLYEDSLESYQDCLSTVQSNLRALGIPEAEWPVAVRPKTPRAGGAGGRKAQVLSAFEELEKALKAKRESS